MADTIVSRSLVVLPTYNERENIEPIVTAIVGQSADLEVLVVDDNSPDGTGEIVDRLVAAQPPAVSGHDIISGILYCEETGAS